jgi:hypothetical protein
MSSSEEKTQVLSILNDIKNLLERQIVLARRGNINDIKALCSQTGSLVSEAAQLNIPELPEFKKRVGDLTELYSELCLILTTEKAETGRQLKRVHKTRKMVGTYRNNI